MEAEHSALCGAATRRSANPGTLEGEARALGMMRPGEQPYVLSGLPDN